jgi:hypothetical protein
VDRVHCAGPWVYESIKTAGLLRNIELAINGPDFMKQRVIFHSNLGRWWWIGRLGAAPVKKNGGAALFSWQCHGRRAVELAFALWCTVSDASHSYTIIVGSEAHLRRSQAAGVTGARCALEHYFSAPRWPVVVTTRGSLVVVKGKTSLATSWDASWLVDRAQEAVDCHGNNEGWRLGFGAQNLAIGRDVWILL